MSKTPIFDAKVKVILDATTPGERTCALTGEKWMMTDEEIGWYKKFNVPSSTYSPKARLWQLGAYYSTFQWWWNKHFETGAPVLTYVHPASGIKVLPDKEWFAKDFGSTHLDFNVERPFFESFRQLQLRIPVNATRNRKEPENAITSFSMGDKDSFFVSGCISKNCLYCLDSLEAEGCVDCNSGVNVTECFRVNHSSRLHRCMYTFESYDCIESAFLFDCRNCEHCFGATNKRNKQYIWFNEQLSKEEWTRRVQELNLGSYKTFEETRRRFFALIEDGSVWPENFDVGTTSSIGDYLLKCSDCRFCSFGIDAHKNYSCYGLYNAEENAYSTAVASGHNFHSWAVESSHCRFSMSVFRCDDCEYSFNCYDCTHCFGCVGLQRKSFCIFNKQYSEAEYWQKIDELKCAMLDRGEYGQALPAAFSFAYFPEGGPMFYLGAELSDWDRLGMQKFAIDADGAFGESRLEGKQIYQIEDLPDDIKELSDEWIGRPIMDREIKRPYTLLKAEVEFYRKYGLPAPRQHFTSRIRDLQWCANAGVMNEQPCAKCGKNIIVSLNRTFKNRKVYCMDDYLQYLEVNG